MEEITTRFEIVRLAVKMADHETISVQARKLRDLSLDQDLNEIIALLESRNYRQALFLMKGYVHSLEDSFFNDPVPAPAPVPKKEEKPAPQNDPHSLFDMMPPQANKTINLDDMLRMTEESAEETISQHEPEAVSDQYISQAKEKVEQNSAYLNIHKNRAENKTIKPSKPTTPIEPIEPIKPIEEAVEISLSDTLYKGAAAAVAAGGAYAATHTNITDDKPLRTEEIQEKSVSLETDAPDAIEEKIESISPEEKPLWGDEVSKIEEIYSEVVHPEKIEVGETERKETNTEERLSPVLPAEEPLETELTYSDTMDTLPIPEPIIPEPLETDTLLKEIQEVYTEEVNIPKETFSQKSEVVEEILLEEETYEKDLSTQEVLTEIDNDDSLLTEVHTAEEIAAPIVEEHAPVKVSLADTTTADSQREEVQEEIQPAVAEVEQVGGLNVKVMEIPLQKEALLAVTPVAKKFDSMYKETVDTEEEKGLEIKRKEDYNKENRQYPPISYIDQKFRNMRHQFPQIEVFEEGIVDEVKILLKQMAVKGYTENDIKDAIGFFQEQKAEGKKAEAAQMLLLAAASESKYAQLLLARELFKGEVLKVDYPEAFTQINRLAEHDYPEAICDLAQLYEYGYGIKKDRKTALLLYEEAAEMGVERAEKHVDRLSTKGGLLGSLFGR